MRTPPSTIILNIGEQEHILDNDYNRQSFAQEYEFKVTLGRRFFLKEDNRELLPEMKYRLLNELAHELFGEFKPTIRNLFEVAYRNGDRETISLLTLLEKQMFEVK